MTHAFPHWQRCVSLLAALNEEQGWGLDATIQQHYVSHIMAIIDVERYLDDDLRQIMYRYHFDHDMVAGLQDRLHPFHDLYWSEWWPQVLRILRRSGLDWTDDVAADSEDLAQIAWTELARSLPTFQYNSRFSTWAHQVITRSVQRVLRDSHAKKRAVRPSSLDQDTELYLPINERDHPETHADLSALYDLARAALSKHTDQRLPRIFKLWQEDDVSVTDLSEKLALSPQRVRSLLGTIRDLLRNDPAIRSWFSEEDSLMEGVT